MISRGELDALVNRPVAKQVGNRPDARELIAYGMTNNLASSFVFAVLDPI
jgi:hypothetical protein